MTRPAWTEYDGLTISPSGLDTFAKCGEKYRRRYVERDYRRVYGVGMLIGKGVHAGAEADSRHKIEQEKPLPKAETVEIAVAGYEAEQDAEDTEFVNDEQAPAGPADFAAGKDKTARVAETYADDVSPAIVRPRFVEEPFELTLPTADPEKRFLVRGIIDLATWDGDVVDLKITGKRWNQDRIDESFQHTVYGWGHKILTGEYPTRFAVENLVHFKRKAPERNRLDSGRGEGDYRAAWNRLAETAATIEAGRFPPAPLGAWWCSAKWCEYFHDCPYVGPERKRGV